MTSTFPVRTSRQDRRAMCGHQMGRWAIGLFRWTPDPPTCFTDGKIHQGAKWTETSVTYWGTRETKCDVFGKYRVHVQGIIHPKRKILAEFTVFKNSLTFFLLWKTKEDILRNVTTAFVHTMKVNGFQNNFGLHWLHWQDFPPKSIYFWKVWDNNYIFFMLYFFWVNCSFMTDICYIQMEYDYIYKYVYMHSIQFDTFKILSCTLPFKSLGARRCVFERSY